MGCDYSKDEMTPEQVFESYRHNWKQYPQWNTKKAAKVQRLYGAKPTLSPETLALVLVEKTSPMRVVFENAAMLRDQQEKFGPIHRDVPLTLRSHPGLAVVPLELNETESPKARFFSMGIGAAKHATRVRMQGRFIVRNYDGFVLHVDESRFESGRPVKLSKFTRQDNSGLITTDIPKTFCEGPCARHWVVNEDGTISPGVNRHLCLGIQNPRLTLVIANSPRKILLDQAVRDALRRGEEAPLKMSKPDGFGITNDSIVIDRKFGGKNQVVGVAPSKDAVSVTLTVNGALVRSDGFALETVFNDGPEHLECNFVKDGTPELDDFFGGLDKFQVRSDGTISYFSNDDLVLGLTCSSEYLDPQFEYMKYAM